MATESDPAVTGTESKPKRAGRKWNLPAPSKVKVSNKALWTLMAFASLVMAILWVAVGELLLPRADLNGPVALGKEFKDPQNNMSIQPPINWTLYDPHDESNIHIMGPIEKRYSPLIHLTMEVAPGKLETYIQEQKDRITAQDKNVQWIKEDEASDVINGCRAHRLVYDVELSLDKDNNKDGTPNPVKVRTLQYIIDQHPRFYRVSCYVQADMYKKYLSRFEASAHTFKPLKIPEVNMPRIQVEANGK